MNQKVRSTAVPIPTFETLDAIRRQRVYQAKLDRLKDQSPSALVPTFAELEAARRLRLYQTTLDRLKDVGGASAPSGVIDVALEQVSRELGNHQTPSVSTFKRWHQRFLSSGSLAALPRKRFLMR